MSWKDHIDKFVSKQGKYKRIISQTWVMLPVLGTPPGIHEIKIRAASPWVRVGEGERIGTIDLVKVLLSSEKPNPPLICASCAGICFEKHRSLVSSNVKSVGITEVLLCTDCDTTYLLGPWLACLHDPDLSCLENYELWESIWEGIDT